MPQLTNILIVENELLIAHMAESMLLELGYKVIGIAKNETEAKALLKTSKIDLVFLDINLKEGTEGIAIGKLINETYKIPFIYVTSYTNKQTIEDAVKTTPGAYVTKPFSKVDLYAAIQVCFANFETFMHMSNAHISDPQLFINVRTNRGIYKLNQRDIIYIKADNVYVDIHTKEKTYTERKSIKKICQELSSETFLRVHRSYLINKNYISSWSSQHVYIDSIPIPLSKSYRSQLVALMF